MRTDTDFSPISPDETRKLAFNFKNDLFPLDPTEKLQSAVFTLEVDQAKNGAADPDPSDHLQGGGVIADSEDGEDDICAVQVVSGMVADITYLVKCIATTTGGQQLELFAKIKCVEAT